MNISDPYFVFIFLWKAHCNEGWSSGQFNFNSKMISWIIRINLNSHALFICSLTRASTDHRDNRNMLFDSDQWKVRNISGFILQLFLIPIWATSEIILIGRWKLSLLDNPIYSNFFLIFFPGKTLRFAVWQPLRTVTAVSDL